MARSKTVIREITDPAEFARSARIIRASFKTVAEQFGLTRENCPTHATFTRVDWLRKKNAGGAKFFGLFEGQRQIGFVAIDKDGHGKFWIERLVVLPAHRNGGRGAKLVACAIDYVRAQRGEQVSLSMMNQHTVLKDWYLGMGFKEFSTRTFPQFPFTVCFMERDTGLLRRLD